MRRLTTLLTLSLTTLSLTACDRGADESALADQIAEEPATATPSDDAAESVAAAPGKGEAAREDKAGGMAMDESEAAPPPPAASAAPEADAFGVGRSGGEGRARPAGPRKLRAKPASPAVTSPSMNVDVRAGEWDDNANYREFQSFLSSSLRLPYHRLDLTQRRFVVVRDADGKGVPSCAVRISDGHKSVELTTAASGRAILFPRAEGLNGWTMNATARCGQDSAERSFSLQAPDGVVDLRLSTKRSLPAQKIVDVAFILDTTGSMSEEIAAVKATIQKVATSLSNDQLTVRLGLVEYKDRTDEVTTKVYPMSRDLQGFGASVASIRASGGGDIPEDAVQGLKAGVQQLAWDDRAVARVAFMIGDAPPHLDYQGGSNYEQLAREAAHRGIKVYTIAASGMDDLGQVVWRQIAQYTGATNMFVLRGGAGPQSTGGGDPKTSCGGTHQNYSSGNLDQLIANKVRREIRALSADPMAIAGLGQDERAKPCNERVANL